MRCACRPPRETNAATCLDFRSTPFLGGDRCRLYSRSRRSVRSLSGRALSVEVMSLRSISFVAVFSGLFLTTSRSFRTPTAIRWRAGSPELRHGTNVRGLGRLRRNGPEHSSAMVGTRYREGSGARLLPGPPQASVGAGLSAAVVTTAWLVTVVSYTVHYARVAATVGGLTFPGDQGVVFWDCVYLATQVRPLLIPDVTIEPP